MSSNPKPNTLWLVVGPSGSGKSTLVRGLVNSVPRLTEAISHTTRAPREGEEDGVHYHFVTRETFQQMLAEDAFCEFVEYPKGDPNSQFYGVARREIDVPLQTGDVVIIVEGHGAEQLLQQYPTAKVLFLDNPGYVELRQRMIGRGDSPEKIESRLKSVEREMSYKHLAHEVIPPGNARMMLAQAMVAIVGNWLERDLSQSLS